MSHCYLYCVINTIKPVCLPEKGLYGQEIRCFHTVDVCILYSHIDSLVYEYRFEDLKIHNFVALRAMEYGVVLPFGFGSIVKDEATITRLIDELYTQFKINFACLDGKVEMGLKIYGDPGLNGDSPLTDLYNSGRETGQIPKEQAGMDYLLDKYRAYLCENKKKEYLEQLVAELLTDMPNVIVESRLTPGCTGKLLLNCSFLVHSDQIGLFKERVKRIKQQYAQSVFILSGPWPPYNFVCVKGKSSANEFKN